ncbi:FYVE zinc finger [Teladorsagia circumcincta]|uniref:FYVE zinc finger n=1 Tax=Teladorsagia circumcincta TaxID=45464 RepID=A0A2G9U5Y8_TELCI|nr:FYVE zinc finger [Teladorsagia circumcincta]
MEHCSTLAGQGVSNVKETIACNELRMESPSDDECRRIAVSVVEAVVDAILDEVEANIDGTFSRSQGYEISKNDGNRTNYDAENSLEEAVRERDCSDQQALQDSCVVQDDVGAPLCASSKESVASGSTDSASFVTVIHRPATECSEQQTQALEEEHTQKDEGQACEIGKPTEDSVQRIHSKSACADANVQAEVQDTQEIPERFESLEQSSEQVQRQAKDDVPSLEFPRGESSEHGIIEHDLSALVNANVEEVSADEEVEDVTQKSDQLSDHTQEESNLEYDSLEGTRSERAGSEESTHGLETAIECEAKEDNCPSPTGPRDRFGAQSKPYWIPDDDCSMCMLCNSRFSLLNRRHHCRACGRVACGSCCKEKATLEYMKDDPKKQAQARVCTPCATMLARIEDYEKMMREHADVDGVKPGASSPSGEVDLSTEEKSSAVKPKKRSRKRHAVARRVAELRLEDELGCALPNATRSQFLVVCPNGEMNTVEEEWIFSSSCDADQAGVRQDFSSLSLPNSPFLIALFLNDAEVPWAMACPNRLLFRLGLKYSWYPTPFVNIVGRQAVYSTETSQTVLKVFTDFRSWSFRMKHLAGSTVTLSNDVTLVEIPKSAKDDLEEIVSFNCKMLAWSTSTNLIADSHLVCDETNGVYSTQVLARGSTRKATGASFLIIDGGLKTNGLQISVVEDGVAIRIPSERLESLLQALNSTENWTTSDASGTHFIVRWTDGAGQPSPYGPVSPIDGQNLANKFQYGLSLERAISSVLQVNSVSDYGVRLSHVYNLKDGRLAPEDEPKVFSIAEMLARECTGMLEPYLTMLINMGIMSISVRVGVSADTVEYDVSPWFGMEEEQLLYKQNMDQLIPVLYDILGYLSGGFHIELVLSFVSTKSLPCVI